MMKDLVEAVPKLPLALTLVSWILGRHSIAATTPPANTGNIASPGVVFCPDIRLADIVIQWLKEGVMGLVHEFKEGKEVLSNQDEMFRGRTAVFSDQVIVGNASLRLKMYNLRMLAPIKVTSSLLRARNANLEYKTGGKLLLKNGRRGQEIFETRESE